MTQVTVTIEDDYAAELEKQHGDLSLWLKGIAEQRFVEANRADALAAYKQGLFKNPAFAKAVADLARADEDFKSPRPKLIQKRVP
jgi:hypothetical protein